MKTLFSQETKNPNSKHLQMIIYSVADLKNQLVREGNSSLVKPYEPDPVRLQGLGVGQTPSNSHLKPASFSKISRQQKVL